VKTISTVQLLPLLRDEPHVVVPVLKLAADRPAIWKPMLAIGAPPLLVMVSVPGALATARVCPGKLKDVGLTAICGGGSPVPERVTVCMRKASETVSVPVCVPEAAGSKATLNVQLDWAASCVVQLLDTSNGPLVDAAIEVRGKPPELVREIDCAGESRPTMVTGKASAPGESVSVG
jgi:hypothetical protein